MKPVTAAAIGIAVFASLSMVCHAGTSPPGSGRGESNARASSVATMSSAFRAGREEDAVACASSRMAANGTVELGCAIDFLEDACAADRATA